MASTTIRAFPGTDREQLLGTRRIPVRAGDLVTLDTGGGAGHGNPGDRNPAAVRRDVAEGYVSASAARTIYGVTDV